MKSVTRFQGGEVFKRQICQIRIFASRPDSYFRPTFAQSTIHFRKYTKLSKCFVATLFINAWLTVWRDMCHLGCVVSSVSIPLYRHMYRQTVLAGEKNTNKNASRGKENNKNCPCLPLYCFQNRNIFLHFLQPTGMCRY